MSLKAACLAVDITPEIGTPIGGNIRDDSSSRGVHDPLYANILYLTNKGTRLLFIGLDVIGVHDFFVNRLKMEIKSKFGISEECVSIFATHTHSGPDVMEAFKQAYDPLVITFLDQTKSKIIEGLSNCLKHSWNARLTISHGTEESISFNRRLVMENGNVRMNWEDLSNDHVKRTTGPIDPEIIVLSVLDEMNTIRSIIINFSLHTAILVGKDWLFSRDFVHYLTVDLQKKLHPDLIVLFANGAEGNINHLNYQNPDQERGFEEAKRVGLTLSSKVLEILSDSKKLALTDLYGFSNRIDLPRRHISEESLRLANELLLRTKGRIPSLLDGVPEEIYAHELIAMNEDGKRNIQTSTQLFVIANTAIVFLPGEFFVELGLEIKEKSPFDHTLIVGLANDYIGYVPNKKAFKEGGYEVKTARSSQLVPEAGDLVVSHVLKMLDQVKEVRNHTNDINA